MKYIIMCGGKYDFWHTPKQLVRINGEPLVARTIRLLRENGVADIAISATSDMFEGFGVPVLHHSNEYMVHAWNDYDGCWCDGFYPMDEPVCYIFGDVFFSPDAIRRIVRYETDDIMFFGSKRPFPKDYPKDHVEPFAFKVKDTKHLREACEKVKELDAQGKFCRKPIAWETWYVICGADVTLEDDAEHIKNENARAYVAINDYTCDIDTPREAKEYDKRYCSILER